ncbi:WD40 repeat domain-containing serine/threonine protein kinase [Singulisphaera sp. PoT]|uniref:WD40 repeat domain-containing serine/threonine protein kinase n=1 Tax=Singulisphaera sp. PoT TaxID=3411797 RepID=UPI003BF4E03F
MPGPDCPSQDDLAAFNLGVLPEDSLERIAEHVEGCPGCEAVLEALDRAPDPVVLSLRTLSGVAVEGGPSQAATLVAPSQVGDYEILAELGRGGMGIVFKAWHAQLQRVVALKMLLSGEFARDEYRSRFRAEAESVARLQHPNIIQIFDIGEWRASELSPPVPYFTLEFVDGGSLSQQLADRPWTAAKSAHAVSTLARAVHHAHGQGIVHRDLKPSNVLITADGRLKLCDFGVAKQLTGTDLKTLNGLLVGTPEYMAPEQADGRGEQAGPAADVYALGAILYTTLTGRPPFQSASLLDLLEQVRSREPMPPRRLQPAVPRDLETICLKCLNKDPRRRYGSALLLAEDLERYQGGLPILARPVGPLEMSWKWTRRRPAVAALSAAVLIVSVLAFVLVLWQWQRAEGKAESEAKARQMAQQARRKAVEEQAELALNQGLTLCDQGEVGHGLLWLVRSLALATEADTKSLDRAIRVNLAEWRSQLGRARSRVRHGIPILDLAISPDGKTLVSVGKGNGIRTWDVASASGTGTPMIPPDFGTSRWIERVAFPPRISRIFVTADEEGRVTSWDVTGRLPVGKPFLHPPGHVIWGMAFTPDGKRLVTCCDDGIARVWDFNTRQLMGQPLAHSDVVGFYTLSLSPDGRKLVTGGRDGRAVLWDLDTGKAIGAPLVHNAPVSALAFCADGERIVTGTRDGKLHVWSPGKGRVADLTPQGTSIMSLATSPDGRIFATGTAWGVVRLWDAAQLGQVGPTFKFASAATALAFLPDGKGLAVGLDDGSIEIWDIPTPQSIGAPLAMNSPIHSVFFGGDGSSLLACGADGARWWNVDTGREQGPLMHSSRLEPDGTVKSSDGRRTYDVVDMTEGASLAADRRSLALARWSGDEGRVRGRVEVWDAQARERQRVSEELPSPVLGAVYSPDGKWLLTWEAKPKTALLWNAETLRDPKPVLRSLDLPIQQAAFTRDGKALLLANRDLNARIWDPIGDHEIGLETPLRHGYPVTAVAYDAPGKRMATGCQDGSVRIWDAATGKLSQDIRGSAGEVVGLAFSPDGSMLLTASHDGTARFWDPESGRQLGPPLRHTDAVLCVAFAPDGKSVATGTKEGFARRWRVPASPDEGSVAEIRNWVEEQTGLQLDELGAVRPLSRLDPKAPR